MTGERMGLLRFAAIVTFWTLTGTFVIGLLGVLFEPRGAAADTPGFFIPSGGGWFTCGGFFLGLLVGFAHAVHDAAKDQQPPAA